MKKRIFGKTGAEVSEVGLGCWQLGGADWGDVSDEKALGILAAAVEAGVTFFDTADVYGNGRSESLIGRFLKQTSEPIFVATKLGRMQDLYPDKYSEKRGSQRDRSIVAPARRRGARLDPAPLRSNRSHAPGRNFRVAAQMSERRQDQEFRSERRIDGRSAALSRATRPRFAPDHLQSFSPEADRLSFSSRQGEGSCHHRQAASGQRITFRKN